MDRIVLAAATAATVLWAATAAEDKPALDRDFLLKAAPHCQALVKYAEIAEKRADNEQIKQFARGILNEHKTLHEDLAKAAKDQKLAVASGTEKSTRDEVDRLSKLDGPAFDQAFMKRVIDEYESGIKMFQDQAEHGTDVRLTEYAKTALPKLKTRLKEAKDLAAKIKK